MISSNSCRYFFFWGVTSPSWCPWTDWGESRSSFSCYSPRSSFPLLCSRKSSKEISSSLMNSTEYFFSFPLYGPWCFSFFLLGVSGNTSVTLVSFIASWTTWFLVILLAEVEVPFFDLGFFPIVSPVTSTSSSFSSPFIFSPMVWGFFFFGFYIGFFSMDSGESSSSFLSFFTNGPWVYAFFFNFSTGFSSVDSEGSESLSSPFSFICSP